MMCGQYLPAIFLNSARVILSSLSCSNSYKTQAQMALLTWSQTWNICLAWSGERCPAFCKQLEHGKQYCFLHTDLDELIPGDEAVLVPVHPPEGHLHPV